MFTSKIGKQPIKSILILSILWIQVFVPVHTSCRITHRSTSAAKDDLRVNSIKSVSPTDWNGGKFESKYTPKSESQAVVDEIGLTEPKSHAPAQSFISEQQKYREYAMEMDNFRVEYNKYKILSHLDITENPNDINPVIDDETRNRLISLEIEREQEANRKLSEKNNNMRHRRAMLCQDVQEGKNVCCLEKLFVNFTDIGWDRWILYPNGFHANYCRGECDLSNARYYHTSILNMAYSRLPVCCSPRATSSLNMLYYDDSNNVERKSLPNMVAEDCDCA